MHVSEAETRSYVNLTCYAGAGLGAGPFRHSSAEHGDLLASSIINGSKLFNDLLLFDQCQFVVSDFSELLSIAFLAHDEMATLITNGLIKLYRIREHPVFFRPGVVAKTDKEGFFFPGLIQGEGEQAYVSTDAEQAFDLAMATVKIENVSEIVKANKKFILENTTDLDISQESYRTIGESTLSDLRAWFNENMIAEGHLDDRAQDNSAFAELLGMMMKDKKIDYLFPSYYSGLKTDAPALEIFQHQFLLNFVEHLTQKLGSTDYRIPSDESIEIKFARLSQEIRSREDHGTDILQNSPLGTPNSPLRLIQLNGVPDPAGYLLHHRERCSSYIALLSSKNARNFRSWFHGNAGNDPDDIVSAYIELLSAQGVVTRGRGRTLRYLVASGAGLIPVVGPIAGLVLSAFDMFFLEHIFSRKRPKLFIEELKRTLV